MRLVKYGGIKNSIQTFRYQNIAQQLNNNNGVGEALP